MLYYNMADVGPRPEPGRETIVGIQNPLIEGQLHDPFNDEQEQEPAQVDRIIEGTKERLPGFAKASGKALANAGTLGLYSAVHDQLVFPIEKKRIETINKKVLQNCDDIRKLASILSPDVEVDNPSEILSEIINRVGKEKCENSLSIDDEIGNIKTIKTKLTPGEVTTYNGNIEGILNKIWESVGVDRLSSPPVSPVSQIQGPISNMGAKTKKKSKKKTKRKKSKKKTKRK
jgi:hypothetical protein